MLTCVLSGQTSTYLCSWLEASSWVILRLSTVLGAAALGGFWQWTQCTSTTDSCEGQNTIAACSSAHLLLPYFTEMSAHRVPTTWPQIWKQIEMLLVKLWALAHLNPSVHVCCWHHWSSINTFYLELRQSKQQFSVAVSTQNEVKPQKFVVTAESMEALPISSRHTLQILIPGSRKDKKNSSHVFWIMVFGRPNEKRKLLTKWKPPKIEGPNLIKCPVS